MNDIILPKELGECELSLDEIGAIFVLYSLKNIDEDSQSYWSGNETMDKIGQSLVERGILKFSKNDEDENIMTIDITNVKSLKKDFWEFYKYDDNDNTVYSHPSNYGDEDTVYHYILTPFLYDDKIVWELKHEEFGVIETYLETKEEAEYLTRQELKRELEQLEQELNE